MGTSPQMEFANPHVDTDQSKQPSPKKVMLIIGVLVLTAASIFVGRIWWRGEHYAYTDDAFTTGRIYSVTTRVAGVITEMTMPDNQSVHEGDVLLKLDPADTLVQLERIKAQIAQAKAVLTRSELDAQRFKQLFNSGTRVVTEQQLDTSISNRDAARANLAELQARMDEEELQLSYTQVCAQAEGRIGKRSVEVGQRVQAGTQLAALVGVDVWITANFKETELAKMKKGQRATITLDAFPGREFKARLDSFSPGSGATFALLPPDNATGNYTKVVQRIPVKLVFERGELQELAGRIVLGLSAEVSVDLRG